MSPRSYRKAGTIGRYTSAGWVEGSRPIHQKPKGSWLEIVLGALMIVGALFGFAALLF